MENNLPQTVECIQSPAIVKDGNVDITAIKTEDVKRYEALGKELNPADVNSILNNTT